ncbi:T9SS type A sorting domain-containing protein [Spirosoma koreense]
MKKLILCRTATILCGLLAIAIHVKPDMSVDYLLNHKLMGATLGLLSAIFGTQWIEYRKRQDAVSSQPGWPSWIRRLLFSSLLGLTGLTANAQTNWTKQIQTHPDNYLTDVAYGAGRYVAIGSNGIIRVSTDGVAWKTQIEGVQAAQNTWLTSIVYAKNQFVAVGSWGQVITSADGLTWVKRASGTGTTLNGITYGGGLFIAVGCQGTAINSGDGIHWTTLTTGTTTNFNDLVYAGSRFVVVGDDGMIRTTPNGIIWTEQQSGTDMHLIHVAAGPTGNLMAIGLFNIALTSANGTTWEKHEYPYYPAGQYLYYTGIFYNPITGKFVINLGGPDQDMLTSLDGKNWAAISSSSEEIHLSKVRYMNGLFIGVGAEGNLGYSATGVNWKWPIVDKYINLYGVAYGNGRYVAVGEYPSEEKRSLRANVALTSVDGQHYGVGETVHLPGGGKCFYDVAFGAGKFVAVGEDAIIQTSTDGKVWSYSSVNFGQTLRGITYGAGWFVAVGDKGLLVRSVDGKTWLQSFIGQSAPFNSVTYANGLFVAVSDYGTIATSSNGIIWTVRNMTGQLKSVAYGNGMWVAVGYWGLVCWSLDGVNWSQYSADPAARFNHVVFANGQFVAVALDGKLYTAPTAFGWTARKSSVPSHLFGLTHGPNQFVAVGLRATDNDPNIAVIITSPDANPQARLADEETGPEVRLQAVAYPNPIQQEFTLTIEGANGQAVRLWLVDLQGRTITERQIQVSDSSHQESMSLDNHEPGTYLLQVSTSSQTKTIRLLKQ